MQIVSTGDNLHVKACLLGKKNKKKKKKKKQEKYFNMSPAESFTWSVKLNKLFFR